MPLHETLWLILLIKMARKVAMRLDLPSFSRVWARYQGLSLRKAADSILSLKAWSRETSNGFEYLMTRLSKPLSGKRNALSMRLTSNSECCETYIQPLLRWTSEGVVSSITSHFSFCGASLLKSGKNSALSLNQWQIATWWPCITFTTTSMWVQREWL